MFCVKKLDTQTYSHFGVDGNAESCCFCRKIIENNVIIRRNIEKLYHINWILGNTMFTDEIPIRCTSNMIYSTQFTDLNYSPSGNVDSLIPLYDHMLPSPTTPF